MDIICQAVQRFGPVIARVLLAQLFVISGTGKIIHFDNTAAYMANAGLPAAKVLLVLTILIEVGGGIALILGWRTRWAATALFVFTFLASIVFHPFWSADAANVTMQMVNFMKNLAIMGGMLYVMAYGAGSFNLGGCNLAAPVGKK